MNKYLSALGIGVLIAVLIAASMSIVNASSSQQTVISCMDITTPGYYYLALNITGLQAGRERCIGIFTSNVVLDGNGYSLLGNGGFGVLINAVNVTVKNIVVAGYDIGVRLESGSGSDRLVNITVRNNRIGVQIGESNNNILIGIVASSNEYGVQVNSAKNNTIISSLIVNNEEDGVQFGMSTYNVYSLYNNIVNTTISNNKNAGIMVLESTTYYLNVVNTTLSNNNYGLYFKLSNRNTVVNSILVNNNWGIVLDHASENVFYNNYFSNNYSNVLIYGGVNTWSLAKTPGRNIVGGDYIGGNYWGSPGGSEFSDTCSDSNSDGVCDEPYEIARDNVDYYPLKSLQSTSTPPAVTTPTSTQETTVQTQDSTIIVTAGLISVIAIIAILLLLRYKRK